MLFFVYNYKYIYNLFLLLHLIKIMNITNTIWSYKMKAYLIINLIIKYVFLYFLKYHILKYKKNVQIFNDL